jgi:major membrane immunogen (membrane-anchored lipoprotein)
VPGPIGFKRLLVISFFIFLCVLLAACSASDPTQGESKTSSQVSQAQTEAVKDSAAANTAGALASNAAQQPAATSGVTSMPAVTPRKMIYEANVQAEVENFDKARSAINALLGRYQGYLLSSSQYETEQEKGGEMVMRIPQAGFSSFLDELDQLATRIPVRSIQGQDVTEEYVDLTSRLKARKAVEARLLQFMSEAKKTEDLLKISADLAKVQEEIEQIQGRMRYLDENVTYSTISLSLLEKKRTAKLDDVADASTWENARLAFHQSLLVILAFLKQLIVFLFGAVPVVLFLAIPGIPGYIYWKRRRQTKQTPPSMD